MLNSQQRVWLLTIGTFALFGVLSARLAHLQTVKAGYFEKVADSQRQRASELAPHRGTVYLKEHGSAELFPVAVNSKSFIAYAVPRDIKKPMETAERLAPALLAYRERQSDRAREILDRTGQRKEVKDGKEAGEDEEKNTEEEAGEEEQDGENQGGEEKTSLAAVKEKLYNKFNKKSDPYEPLLRFYETLDEELRNFLEEKKLPGIVVQEQVRRTYPEKSLAAHVLGYVGWEEDRRTGRYGVEGYFQEQLVGHLGFFSAEQDSSGGFIDVGDRELQPAQDGSDIVLTVDRVIQSIIEDELARGVERYEAKRGSIIVMAPRTGAVLGMATYPTYDPNYYYAINDARVQLNPAVSEIFEPGSILKPLIMAAAIDEGTVRPDTTFVDSGPVKVAEYTIDTYDGKHHGLQTMTQVLEKSNNVGMVWVARQLGSEVMYDYLRRFGLGEKTGIELEGETNSSLPEPDDWDITTIATVAFGQGIALTPLQVLNAINSLANGGVLHQPRIVDEIRSPDGGVQSKSSAAVRRVVSSKTAEQLSAMMVSVIENGVGALARVPGYYLAGKTGTAQVPDERGKYDPDRKIISFVGYGPVSNPRFAILIKLDDPAGLSLASGTAAPMFRNVVEKIISYYQIPPDYNPQQPKPTFLPPEQHGNPGA